MPALSLQVKFAAGRKSGAKTGSPGRVWPPMYPGRPGKGKVTGHLFVFFFFQFFSFGVSRAFFFFPVLPLSLLPLSPISVSPRLKLNCARRIRSHPSAFVSRSRAEEMTKEALRPPPGTDPERTILTARVSCTERTHGLPTRIKTVILPADHNLVGGGCPRYCESSRLGGAHSFGLRRSC